MSEPSEPIFRILLRTLENESAETKAMFFSDPEQDLMAAYQEGKEARLKRLPVTANPYPQMSAEDLDAGKYSKHTCWGEGFLSSFLSEF